MRPIHLIRMERTRPALVLTRQLALPSLRWVTVAPITSTVRGLATEVAVSSANGLDHDSVVSLDNVTTIAAIDLGRQIGRLLPHQEVELTDAIHAAFDLD